MSLVQVAIALALMAAFGSLTELIIRNRLEPAQLARDRAFIGFVERFEDDASQIAGENAANPNFTASSLAGTYALAPESDATVTVEFEGCTDSRSLLQANVLSESDANALEQESTVQTPAEAVAVNQGQVGGILLNEVYAQRLGNEPTLFTYRLSGTRSTRSHISYIIGEQTQCR